MADRVAALRAALDGFEPDGFDALSDDDLATLTAEVERTRREHREELAVAGEQALRHVPRLLRPAVRKVVGL